MPTKACVVQPPYRNSVLVSRFRSSSRWQRVVAAAAPPPPPPPPPPQQLATLCPDSFESPKSEIRTNEEALSEQKNCSKFRSWRTLSPCVFQLLSSLDDVMKMAWTRLNLLITCHGPPPLQVKKVKKHASQRDHFAHVRNRKARKLASGDRKECFSITLNKILLSSKKQSI